METDQVQKKVLEYEKFINEVLQRDLSKVLEQRDEVNKTIAEYLQLKNTLERLQELDDKALKTEVDLGCNFFVCAEVPDSSRIFMAVGYGFFAELTLEEALRFIEKKSKLLTGSRKLKAASKFSGIGAKMYRRKEIGRWVVDFPHFEWLKTEKERLSKSLSKDAAKIKANIRLVLEGLRELQGLSNLPEETHQNIF
uniref:Protein UXT isoform X1 n=1 Tax=Geotrypetes seraphini TaxID=260995 RepID=A0A6P8PYF6_GEOSA|nr:protein UXT isoform X1 [Geotrypetes seraphini]XP_033780140.1 protein UXT isoform X1 [Geotrypetes seraphini]XP_033780151.1 protein UXT isoform X1 [Geotrypetes seraphini]